MPIDISALESQFKTKPRGKEMLAEGVTARLAAEILKAHFGEELTFPRKSGAVMLGLPEKASANAEYDLSTGNITVRPDLFKNDQTAYMRPSAHGGYIGDGTTMPSTQDVLDYVQTLRHEGFHSRTPRGSYKDSPEGRMLQLLGGDRNKLEMAKSMLRGTELPSMDDPGYEIEEFLATAVPLKSAEQKYGTTSARDGKTKQQGNMADINYAIQREPMLSKLLGMWARPELQSKK